MRDFADALADLRRRVADAHSYLRVDEARVRLGELAHEEQDESVVDEIDAGVGELGGELDQLELRALFTGEHDERDAICEVHSGAGGTDSQDWAAMLLRMFTRWAESKG